MRSLIFEGTTWLAYEQLREQDQKLHEGLNKISKEIKRSDPSKGLGKPEALKHNLTGFHSKRIFQKDHLIYKFDDLYIYIFAIGGDYDDH
ncbi:MAG: type II toxin-antitoxin system YoeB family toxin [Saccharospirillaceae bacterium]|nr:type II toxin-antitoxin system YoeB family toxin [Pseudomonadales bacterium]NRB78970.1 type II toxin-antitoxin system YoeB family toxin [Saccharospirillaceae bacterium]